MASSIPPVAQDNPAGRLRTLFADLSACWTQHAPMGDPLTHIALSEVWNLAWPAQRAQVLRRVADASNLSEQVVKRVSAVAARRLEVDLDDHLLSAGQWHQALVAMHFLSGQLKDITGHVQVDSQRDLARCARLLHYNGPEPLAAPDDLDVLAVSLRDLIDDVLAAELDEELRSYLLMQLRTLQDAVAGVALRGVEALRDGLDRVVGNARGSGHDRAERLRREHQPWAQRLLEVVNITAAAATLAVFPGGLDADYNLVHQPPALSSPAPARSVGPSFTPPALPAGKGSAALAAPSPAPGPIPSPAPAPSDVPTP